MKNEVFWKNPGYKIRKNLNKNIECDYLIVGGGVTGVSTAYFLAKKGAKNIILIEKDHIASGATGMAAGVLTPHTDQFNLKELIDYYGHRKGLLFWYNTIHSLHKMKQIIKNENIDCDFEEEPTIAAEYNYKSFQNVLEEYNVTKEVHLYAKLLLKKELEKEIHTKLFSKGVLSYQGASINPLKYSQNLSKKLDKMNVKIYENTPLIEIKDDIAHTKNSKIKFKKVILAIDAHHKISKIKPVKTTIAVTKRLTKKQLKQTGLINKLLFLLIN